MDDLIQQYQDHAKNGFYSHHLSEITDKGNQAFTTSDVLNDNGVLLARKGVPIDQGVRKRLVNHKLLKPLDNDIGLERHADTKTLITEFKQLLDRHPDLNTVNDALRFGPEFERLLKLERLHPLVTHKLTVLEAQMRPEFEKGIFSAWMATMIAREMELSEDEVRDTLVAALIHDIGLLHLDPDIVCSNRKLSADEWNTVRAHVVVGKIIADAVPGLSTEIPRAIIEHHEDCFGSGYPYALKERQLATPGRIIGMTDSIHSIRIKSFKNSQRTLGDIKPFLQLNPTTRGHDVYRAVMSIIKKSGLQQTIQRPDDCPTEYAKKIGKQVDILRVAKGSLDHIHSSFVELRDKIDEHDQKELATLASITNRIRTTIHESGLLSNELAEWLNRGRDLSDINDNILEELNEIELLIKELTWQIRNSVRMFCSYNNSDATNDQLMLDQIDASVQSIQGIFEQLSELEA